jgi:hypothetical protein
MSPRQDLALRLMDQGWVSQQLVALAVAVLAASAAFSSVIPGHHRRWAGLMLVPLVAWVAGLGQGCLEELSRVGLGGLTPQTDWTCLPGLLATGAVPATVMAFMLRRGAPLTPVWTMVMGGVAAGGLGDFALRLVHSQDVGVMVLAWHIGAVSLLGAVAGLSGPFVLVWRPDVLRSAGAVLS